MSATATISIFFFNLLTQVQSTLLGTTLYRTPTAFFCMARFNVLMLQSLKGKMFQHKGCDNMLQKQCHPYGRAHVGKKYKTTKNMCFRTKTWHHHGTWGPVAAYFTAAGHSVSLLPVSHCAHSAVVLMFHYVSDFHCCVILLQYCTSIAEVPL